MQARPSAVAVVLVGISVALVGAQTQQAQSVPTPIQSGFGQGAYMPGSGVSDPVLIKEVKPEYTAAARQAGIQGTVELEAVLLANGVIGDVRVVKSLDKVHGLDDAAVAAARKWLFKPGYAKDVAVPVLITLILEFRPIAGEAPNPNRPPSPMAPAMRPGGRVTDPELLKERRPTYSESAMRQKIEGAVELEAIVGVDGSVTQVRVTKSLDNTYGLDQAAIDAARQWKFKPGTLEGTPVPVLITLILEFRLK